MIVAYRRAHADTSRVMAASTIARELPGRGNGRRTARDGEGGFACMLRSAHAVTILALSSGVAGAGA